MSRKRTASNSDPGVNTVDIPCAKKSKNLLSSTPPMTPPGQTKAESMSDPKHRTQVKTSTKKHTSWSASEEKKFLEAIDRLMRAHLWNEVKGDQEVSLRGANGVRSHWEALYRKLKKGN